MLLLGAVIAGIVAVVLGGNDSDSDGDETVTTATTTTLAPLSDTAEDLLALLERGREEPMHVRLESAESGTQGLTVEIWRDGERVRQDLVLTSADVRTELSAFQLPEGNSICQRASAAEWVCQEARSVATEAGAPAGLVEAATANLNGAEVTVREQEVAGFQARCFVIDGVTESSLCVTADGVPVRLAVDGQELTAVTVERSAPEAAFDLPAEATGA